MRAILGVLSLLLVLAVVGVVAKKQVSGNAAVVAPVGLATTMPGATPGQQSGQIQQQYQQAIESAMQQPKTLPEESR